MFLSSLDAHFELISEVALLLCLIADSADPACEEAHYASQMRLYK